MQTIALLFFLQSIYSFLSTCRINDAVGNVTRKYVLSAALSDMVKYAITASIAVQVVLHDQWLIILTTVLGGVVGNTIGHRHKLKVEKKALARLNAFNSAMEEQITNRETADPFLQMDHVDGPLLVTSEGTLHWLTIKERVSLFFGAISVNELNNKHKLRNCSPK